MKNVQKVQKASKVFSDLAAAEKTPRMPVLFVGHGNPMNAIEDNAYSQEWQRIGQNLPRPRAIVCMSAHWVTEGSFVTAMPNPRTIYDFYGFPPELYQVHYPASGSPTLAEDVCKIVQGIELDHEWGLDHGAWSVLKRMFPEANIPVLQLSIDFSKTPQQQYTLMQELRGLREKGILFVGSGNIVHNLRAVRFDDHAKPYDWALEFDALSKKLLEKGDHQALIHYEKLGPEALLSIPTEEHYRPMLMALGLLGTDEISHTPKFFNEGIDAGSVAMRSMIF